MQLIFGDIGPRADGELDGSLRDPFRQLADEVLARPYLAYDKDDIR